MGVETRWDINALVKGAPAGTEWMIMEMGNAPFVGPTKADDRRGRRRSWQAVLADGGCLRSGAAAKQETQDSRDLVQS